MEDTYGKSKNLFRLRHGILRTADTLSALRFFAVGAGTGAGTGTDTGASRWAECEIFQKGEAFTRGG